MIELLKSGDVSKVKVQPKQEFYRGHVEAMAEGGHLVTAYSYKENGAVKAVIGAQPHWEGRSELWALIGDVNNWVTFHREVEATIKGYTESNKIKRLELTTEVGFYESERWALMLGFKQESYMPCYGMDGKDHKMWVVI